MRQCGTCNKALPAISKPGYPRRYCSDLCKSRKQGAGRKARRRGSVPVPAPECRASDAELGWLAGIIDGEGSIALSHGSTGSPHLRVGITNGSDAILDKVRDILRLCGLTWAENDDRRGTVNITVGTAGALRLHQLLRADLVRQCEQYDAAVTFMRRRYVGLVQRVRWTADERAEWEGMRRRFHAKRGVFRSPVGEG